METFSTMNFYLFALSAALLTLITSFVSYYQDKDRKNAIVILVIAIISVAMTFLTGHYAHKESLANQDSATVKDNLYRGLLNKNLESAHTIIDSVNYGLLKTRGLIKGNNSILEQQGMSSKILNSQLVLSSQIQNDVIQSSGHLRTEVSATRTKLDNLITGGDAYLDPLVISDGAGVFKFCMIDSSENALPNVTVSISNYDSIAVAPFVDKYGYRFIKKSVYARFTREYNPTNFSAGIETSLPNSNEILKNSNQFQKFIIMQTTPKHLFVTQVVLRLGVPRCHLFYRILMKLDKGYKTVKIYNIESPNIIDWDKEFDAHYNIFATEY
jgi:hypothetical protein